ncbi:MULTISPECIES: hypothetical protein [Micromonospora]|nr:MULTISPECIES: hypothetical protein [Micromonospora]
MRELEAGLTDGLAFAAARTLLVVAVVAVRLRQRRHLRLAT